MSKRAPGFKDYTPSRLEWLVVLLNSLIQYVHTLPEENVEYAYLPASDGKTILLYIRYPDDLDPGTVKILEDTAKKFAMDVAKNNKWDSWVNSQTQLKPIKEQPENSV